MGPCRLWRGVSAVCLHALVGPADCIEIKRSIRVALGHWGGGNLVLAGGDKYRHGIGDGTGDRRRVATLFLWRIFDDYLLGVAGAFA